MGQSEPGSNGSGMAHPRATEEEGFYALQGIQSVYSQSS